MSCWGSVLVDEMTGAARRNRLGAAPAPPVPNSRLRLRAFSRALTSAGAETGQFSHYVELGEPSGISTWQAVDGGLYYLAGDKKLHFLRGARE